MRLCLAILFILILSCRTRLPKCNSYKRGQIYFAKHNHGDYMDDGSRDTVIAYLVKADSLGCSNFDLYYLLYYCYDWDFDFINAEKYLSKAIVMDERKDPELYYWRGDLNLKLKRLPQAKADFEDYLRFPKVKRKMIVYANIGFIYYVLGDTSAAVKFRRRAIELNNNRDIKDYKEAAKSFRL